MFNDYQFPAMSFHAMQWYEIESSESSTGTLAATHAHALLFVRDILRRKQV